MIKLAKCPFNRSTSSALLCFVTTARASTTKSRPQSAGTCLRNVSRTNRLIRLRSTARRSCFLAIARPRREVYGCELRGRASTVKQASDDFSGLSKTRRKSPALSNRCSREKDCGKAGPRLVAGRLLSRCSDQQDRTRSACQAGAALGTTGVDHFAATTSSHSGTKTVSTDTL